MDNTVVIALISLSGAVIGSGGITAIINHFLSRKGKTAKQLDRIEGEIEEVRNDVQSLEDKVDKNEAQRARTQILRFADEMYQGQLHTKEHFDEILSAITLYKHFCDTHPLFENQRTEQAQRYINEVYDKCLDEHTFLEGEIKNDTKQVV